MSPVEAPTEVENIAPMDVSCTPSKPCDGKRERSEEVNAGTKPADNKEASEESPPKKSKEGEEPEIVEVFESNGSANKQEQNEAKNDEDKAPVEGQSDPEKLTTDQATADVEA